MPLNKLENFIKSVDGRTIYVNPNDINATDSITNQGTSLTQPFKSIQRALLESARFSYIRGNDNDIIEKTTIILSPATHFIDNRPGYGVRVDDVSGDAIAVSPSGSEVADALSFFGLTPDTNFEVLSSQNTVWHYNSIYGGVIIPRGTSIVGMDLRKTKIIPLYVPNPTDPTVASSAIFRVTGGCYINQFTVFDGDKDTPVYTDSRDFSGNNQSLPTFSHHKLSVFEYADGVNVANQLDFGLTDLNIYYSKLSNAYNSASTRPIDEKYPDFPESFISRRPEFEIVGALATDPVQISNLISGDGFTPTALVTVTTSQPHGLDAETPIKIRGVNVDDYNISSQVTKVIDVNTFTYSLSFVRANLPASPGVSSANVTVETDNVSGSSPYIFNISMRSVWGMNGLVADGSKATGFRSIVVAQFTAISLQKDDRSFVKYNEQARRYDGIDISDVVRGAELSAQSSSTNTSTVYHLDPKAIYRPEWTTTHIRISNDAVMQIVSVFSIGFNQHYIAESGGDASITNSNSNFGQNSLVSSGFRADAFSKDDQGFVTHLITPRTAFNPSETTIDEVPFLALDFQKTRVVGSPNQIFILDATNVEIKPASVSGSYKFGAKFDELITQPIVDSTPVDAIPVMSDSDPGSSNPIGSQVALKNYFGSSISGNTITLQSQHNLLDAEKVRVLTTDGDLPENVDQNTIYYAIISGLNSDEIQLATTESNALNGFFLDIYGIGSNLVIESRVNDKVSGDAGHPIQWDSDEEQWFVLVQTGSSLYQFIVDNPFSNDNLKALPFVTREPVSLALDDTVYRIRYVIPRTSVNTKPPTPGYILQQSSRTGARTNADFNLTEITEDDYGYRRNERFISSAIVNVQTSELVYTTELRHNLRVGDTVDVLNVQSSNNLSGSNEFGYNGKFLVTQIENSKIFRTSNVDVFGRSRNPGNFIQPIGRSVTLPRFETKDNQANLYVYRVDEITPLVEGIRDGIYHLYVMNSNNPVEETFTDREYSQPVKYFYPQKDEDNVNNNPNSSISYSSRSPLGEVTIDRIQNSVTRESIDKFKYTYSQGVIASTVDLGTSIDLTFTQDHRYRGVYGYSSLVGGSGYDDGVWYNVKLLVGVDDNNTTAKVTVIGGSVTEVEIMDPGGGYPSSGTLNISATNIGGGAGSGASISYDSTTTIDNAFTIIQVTGTSDNNDNESLYSYVESVVDKATIRIKKSDSSFTNYVNKVATPTSAGISISSTSVIDSTTLRLFTSGVIRNSLQIGETVVLFDSSGQYKGKFIVTRSRTDSFDVYTTDNLGAIILAGKTNLDDNDSTTGAGQENIGIRGSYIYDADMVFNISEITRTDPTITVSTLESGTTAVLNRRLQLGTYLQVDAEIMRVSSTTFNGPNSNIVSVIRGALGTSITEHPVNSRVNVVNPFAIELHRPSILRASGHTFEYLGYGPGNYSTSLPQLQVEQLSDDKVYLAQAQKLSAGQVVYSGMSDNGDFYIGNIRFSSTTGKQITFDVPEPSIAGGDGGTAGTTLLNTVVIANRLIVEGGAEQTAQSEFNGPVRFNSSVRIQGDTNINELLVNESVNIQKDLTVSGITSLSKLFAQEIETPAIVANELTVIDSTYLSGITTIKDLTIEDLLTVDGTTNFNGDVNTNANLNSNSISVTSLEVTGLTTMKGDVLAESDMLVEGEVTIEDTLTIDKDIHYTDTTNSGNYVSLQGPDTLSTSYDLSFPSVAPPVGTPSVLVSDDSGQFDWETYVSIDALTTGLQVGMAVSFNSQSLKIDYENYVVSITTSPPDTITTKNLVINEFCSVPDESEVIMVLPENPEVGNRVYIGVLENTEVVVDRNGSNIMGLDEDMTIDLEYRTVELIYVDATIGWKIV